MTVRIQLLGPLRAWRDSDELNLGGPQQRAVLGLLAASAAVGSVLSPSELIDTIWEEPPASGDNVIQTYLKRLRRLLEPDRPPHAPSRYLRRVAGGHQLQLSEVDLDLVTFRQLVNSAGDPEQDGNRQRTARQLGEALRLWHGPPLANVPLLVNHPTIVALAAERWAAVARYGEAMLAIDQAAHALPTLEHAAAACPLDESAHARLIRAHQAAGNRGRAFATYHAIRTRLADELGIDPGAELAAAHHALLHDDPPPNDSPTEPGERPAAVSTTVARPAQLPAGIAGFVGRAEQLRQLDKLLDAEPAVSAATIAAIVGAAGIGKTTLALHWAHHVKGHFPDGQLFVNLRGYDSSRQAMTPAEAVRGLLDALQVPPHALPSSLDAQVGLYRSLLADRRVLILLDNARDSDQVSPLLPGVPGCLVLVTSRHQLTGLVAGSSAHTASLDLLPTEDARQLLEHRIGADRINADPRTADEIIQLCGGLPLALAIVAARIVTRPGFPLDAVVRDLHGSGQNLDAFDGGDRATDLRAVFSWSYHALTSPAARLFRLLALHPGPDISTSAAASLAALPTRQARLALAELSRTSLATEGTPGRYMFHDLIRAHATELVHDIDTPEERTEALHRLLDHYVHTGYRSALLLEPNRTPLALVPPEPGTAIVDLADHRQAQAWFTTEQGAMLNAVALAADQRFDRHAWQIAWVMMTFLDHRGQWHHLVTALHIAIESAVRLGDRQAQASAHRNLAYAYGHQQRFDDAVRHAEQSFALYEQLDYPVGCALVHRVFSWLSERQDRHEEGLRHDQSALDLFRAANHRTGEANSLNAIGWDYAKLGEHRLALGHCQQALPIFEELGDLYGQGLTWDSIGYAHHHLGEHQQAIACFHTALALLREVGDRYYEAGTYIHIGDTYCEMSDAAEAQAAWRSALTILEMLDHPDADQVRAKLDGTAG